MGLEKDELAPLPLLFGLVQEMLSAMSAIHTFCGCCTPQRRAAYQKTCDRVYAHTEQADAQSGQSRHVDPEMAMDGCRRLVVHPITFSVLL